MGEPGHDPDCDCEFCHAVELKRLSAELAQVRAERDGALQAAQSAGEAKEAWIASSKAELDQAKARIGVLERQLSEPGYVDALRGACEGVAKLLDVPPEETELGEQIEGLPDWVEWTLDRRAETIIALEAWVMESKPVQPRPGGDVSAYQAWMYRWSQVHSKDAARQEFKSGLRMLAAAAEVTEQLRGELRELRQAVGEAMRCSCGATNCEAVNRVRALLAQPHIEVKT